MSDTSHNSDGGMLPPPARKGGFDFDLDDDNSEEEEFKLPVKA